MNSKRQDVGVVYYCYVQYINIFYCPISKRLAIQTCLQNTNNTLCALMLRYELCYHVKFGSLCTVVGLKCEFGGKNFNVYNLCVYAPRKSGDLKCDAIFVVIFVCLLLQTKCSILLLRHFVLNSYSISHNIVYTQYFFGYAE